MASFRSGAALEYAPPTIVEGLPAPVSAVVLAGKSPLLTAAAGKAVHVCDRPDKDWPASLAEQPAPLTCLAGLPGTSRFYTGSEDGSVKVWDPEGRTEKGQLPAGTGPIKAMTLSGNGQVLAFGDASGAVLLWNTAEDKLIRKLQLGPGNLSALALNHDGTRLLVASKQLVRPFDVTTGKESAGLLGNQEPVANLALAPDGQLLAVVDSRGKAFLWDLALNQERAALQVNADRITALLFTPDGKTLIIGGGDGSIRLWEVNTGQELLSLRAHSGAVTALAFDPETMRLVSGGADRTLRIW